MPGESVTPKYGELVIAAADTRNAYLFPRAVSGAALRWALSFADPHCLQLEFRIFPAADGVILRKTVLQAALANQLPPRHALSPAAVEAQLLDAVSLKISLGNGYEWSLSGAPELPGVRLELSGESGARHPYARIFFGRFALKFHSVETLRRVYTALMELLPLTVGDIYRLEAMECELTSGAYPYCATIAVKIWVKR